MSAASAQQHRRPTTNSSTSTAPHHTHQQHHPPLRLSLLRRTSQRSNILHPLNSSAPKLSCQPSPLHHSPSSEILLPSPSALPIEGPRIATATYNAYFPGGRTSPSPLAAMDRSRLSTQSNTPNPESTDGDTSRSDTPNIRLPLEGPGRGSPAIQEPQTQKPNTAGSDGSWLAAPDRDEEYTDVDLEKGTHAENYRLRPLSAHGQGEPSAAVSRPSQESRETSASDQEWNSQHPCYPHRNPHVPIDSPEYESTRVIRIPRDYMYSGDISPAFSNVYPEILEPFLDEERFRVTVKHVNEMLLDAHDPYDVWNWVDALLGVVTFWLWEDVVGTKGRLRIGMVERWLEGENRRLREEGREVIWAPLGRTGFMNLDIQIPDPVIGDDDASEDGESGRRPDLKGFMEGVESEREAGEDVPDLLVNGQMPLHR